MAELAESNWSAVARRYGVSDNAVRKWCGGTRPMPNDERRRNSAQRKPRKCGDRPRSNPRRAIVNFL
jgi:hypothetical protein